MAYEEVHGVFLLNKPEGITSNRALQKVRRLFNAAKAGHTGSLDPIATGMLPCCFGDSTKIAGLMLNSDKEYIAECQIGFETDTGDRTGTKTKQSEKLTLSQSEIVSALNQYTGPIQQIPPMYSAIHHNGKRLYELARKGEIVERPPRYVIIHEIELLSNSINSGIQTLCIRAKVSKGTYIRTLLEDIAKACGTFAHMTKLHRTSLGDLNGNMTDIESLRNHKNPRALLQNMDIALMEHPRFDLNQEQLTKLIHGLRITSNLLPQIYRLYDPNAVFMGLGEALDIGQLKVKKLFLKSYQQQSDKI